MSAGRLPGDHPVSEARRDRMMSAIRELDHVTHAHARSPAAGGAIVIDNRTGAAFAPVAEGAARPALPGRYHR
ncbi:hypothetical protein AB0L59_11625 [Streptomyces sp. NPDC052109]|uniref:hypothetical protein n=1 Tax=Streptomyces sp. NPDC052109 TaxID=3155527 RepID=UPI003425EE13